GIGFAIPSNRAKEIMGQLIEKGRVVRGWIGVEITPLTDVMARQFGVPDTNGVVINQVAPESPAERAGLKRGDVMRKFEGKDVTTAESLQEIVAGTPPKKRVKVQVIRKGRPVALSLVTREMPSMEGEMPSREEGGQRGRPEDGDTSLWEGARLATLSPALTEHLGVPRGTRGVVVLDVEPGSLADQMGLAGGDVVASVNQRRVQDVKSFLKTMGDVDLKEGVLLDVSRQGHWVYLSYQKGQ
ncbi:MAG: PDZ domain-containing protein, partial [Elusimicrobia bacterium]|nr:PDZ domain-containing protein [Elusimicrobiota bacterium]